MTNFEGEIVDDEDGLGNCLLLRGSWNQFAERLVSRNKVDCLRFSEDSGWKEHDVEFLNDLPPNSVSGIEIYSHRVSDVSPLARFPTLKKIGLQTIDAKGFQSSDFPNLQYLNYFWTRNGVLDSFPSSLLLARIIKYPAADLEELPAAKGLETLLISARNISSLQGLKKFPSIRRLIVLEARKLSDISSIVCLEKLQELTLDGAAKIDDLSAISVLSDLRYLRLNNCSKIPSIEFLAGIEGIERLEIMGNTQIEDGNLSIIEGMNKLKSLQIIPKRNYSPKPSVLFSKIYSK